VEEVVVVLKLVEVVVVANVVVPDVM